MSDICLSPCLSFSPPVLDVQLPVVFFQSNLQWGNITHFLTCHEWSEDAIFSAKVFFFFLFLKESRPRAWGFLKRQNDRETQRRGEMKCVNKRVSIIFVTFCYLFVGHPSLAYMLPPVLNEKQTADMRTNSFSLLFPPLFPFLYTYITVSPPDITWLHLVKRWMSGMVLNSNHPKVCF